MAPLHRSAAAHLLAALAVLFFTLPAAALVIDDFEAGDFTVTDTTGTSGSTFGEVSGLPGANVIGGVRMIRTQATSTGTAASTAALVTTGAPDAALLSVTGVPTGSADFDFIYDGVANTTLDGTAGTLGVDLTGFASIVLDATAPTATANVRLTLWSATAVQNSATVALVDGLNVFSLSSFTINKADIRSIRVSILGLDELQSVSLNSIDAVVPEPGTALLLAAGLGGLALRRQRRR